MKYREEGDHEFCLEFAGDFFHKNDVSGGAPTYAVLPADAADARVFWFVDYLRRYFERGGFRRMRPDHTYPPAFWPGLADGLLDI